MTVIQAGAGFGKSTLLAQAVRANTMAPTGIDVWHACAPGDVDSDALGSALLRALGVDRPARSPAGQIVESLTAFSPLDVCLVLDDAHEIRPGSSGAALVDGIIRRLPDNAHVVLATRHTVPAALSRLRAADRLLEIGEHDLLFTADEIAAIADRLGRRPEAAIELGGWPALVRLALAVRPDVAIDFAQEEVLSQLTGPRQRALFALAHLGYADADRVERVVGEPVDLADLALTVPLVSRTDDDRFRAHELWAAALLRVLDRGRRSPRSELGSCTSCWPTTTWPAPARWPWPTTTSTRSPRWRARPSGATRRHSRSTWCDPSSTCSSAAGPTPPTPSCSERRSVMRSTTWTRRSTPSSTPPPRRSPAAATATVRSWRSSSPPSSPTGAATSPASSRSPAGPTASRDRATRPCSRSPGARSPPSSPRCPAICPAPWPSSTPRRSTLVPPAISTAVQHLVIHCLLLSGRADDAVTVARQLLAQRPDRLARYLSAIAGWMAGEPAELLALNRSTVDIPAVTSRDYFVRRTVVAAMLASTGQRDGVHQLVTGSSPVAEATANARDAVLDAVARALCAVVDHDDETAASSIVEVVAAHADSPILDQHLRRFLPLVYVLDPSVRARWDEASMGPTHEHARRASRCLVDLRAGHARRGACAGSRQGVHLLPAALGDRAGRPPPRRPPGGRARARRVAGRPGSGAGARRAAPPRRQQRPVRPGGRRPPGSPPGDADSTAGDLRARTARRSPSAACPQHPRHCGGRGCARLLALLVVHRTLSRERATDLLWPDLSPRDGARNLRVTLTYLRQLLEPGRPTGEASFHLRADGTTISLHPSDHLVVDLWELRRLRRDTEQNRGRGDPGRTIALLGAATAWWRGEPLADLATVAGHEHEIEHIRVMQLESLLELGELRLVRGDADQARTDAERALDLDPYSERAHRLAIAAALRTHDQRRIDAVRQRTRAMLDELGVAPEPPTQILLRQADHPGATRRPVVGTSAAHAAPRH